MMLNEHNDAFGLSNLTTFKFRGLSSSATAEEVKEYFSRFGQIFNLNLEVKGNGKRTGFFSLTVASVQAAAVLSSIPVHVIGQSECHLVKPNEVT